ncbi:DUF397 domain-containing protein [Uniformispora flossi]|uniref:DUF397 domain-containing protein n=1 Tax=Uniformispora flossi TaxID=3390723 RepID=UPI003C2D69DD
MIQAREFGNAVWRKSSYSNPDGGNCVEVASFPDAAWRMSSHTNGEDGNCVEVAGAVPEVVPVRDSKRRGGSVLLFSNSGWTSLVASVKSSMAG